MPIDLMTSTMKSDPGRPITFSPEGAVSFFSEFDCWAATVVAAIVVLIAAALLRNARRSIPSSLMRASLSANRGRRHARARGAVDLERLHREGELVDALRDQLVELEVLDDVPAVHPQTDLVHRQAQVLVRVRRHLDRPVVGADQHRILLRQPFRRAHADAGRALHEARVVLAVELAPAGVDDDGVAGLQLQLLALERLLQVGGGDLVAVAEHLYALQAGDVDQHAAREEGRRVLHAELGEARARRYLARLEAVVVRVTVRLVREAVELRADLADL